MKLILCTFCGDVYSLKRELKQCGCGRTWGKYKRDGLHAQFSGDWATPLGFANNSLNDAVHNQPPAGSSKGREFTAFVIQEECPTFEKVVPFKRAE